MSIRFYLFSIFSFALLSSCGSKKEDCVFDVEYKGAYFTNSFKYKDVKKEADSTTEILVVELIKIILSVLMGVIALKYNNKLYEYRAIDDTNFGFPEELAQMPVQPLTSKKQFFLFRIPRNLTGEVFLLPCHHYSMMVMFKLDFSKAYHINMGKIVALPRK